MQISRLTRRESTELTRRKLVDGALDILRKEGVGAATTGRIARAAGLKQPSFYVHFADRDEILKAAATKVGQQMIETLQHELSKIDPADTPRSIRAAEEAIFDAFLRETELTRIFLRHRTDDGSVLGRAFRHMLDQARAELVRTVEGYGLSGRAMSADLCVEILVAAVLGVLEGLLDGRLRDRAAAVDAIAGLTSALMRELRAPP